MFDGLETRDVIVFGAGFTTACFVIWLLLVVGGWLKQIVKSGQASQPSAAEKPGEEVRPFRQRLRAAFRNLAAIVLMLLVLAMLASMAYSTWLQPNP